MQDTSSLQPSEEQPKASSPSQENQPSQTNTEETAPSLTLPSREMPQWLRSELETGKQEEIEGVGATPEGTQREAGQLHEELASTGRPMAAPHPQISSMREHQAERGGCLTAWLIFVGIVNTLVLIFGFAMTSTLGPLSLLYVANGAIALAGVVGIWQLKKWGYYTLLALYLIGFVGSFLVVRSTVSPLVSSLVGLLITSYLVMNRWENFE
jgi:hypothetical protein